jgi:hypothetical protein
MRVRCCIAAGILGLALPLTAAAQEETKISGRVVDASGKPVASAEVASFWNAANDKMQPNKGVTTNAEGRFTIAVEFYGRGQALLALDKDRKTGGLIVVEPKDAGKPAEIKLVPLVYVHGKMFCKELNKRPEWTNVYLMSGQARFLFCSSNEASFSFRLPPGTYKFWGYGTDIQDVKKDITLKADEPNLDLRTIDAPAEVIARYKGKVPPAWHVTDARGVKKDVKLSDFKGKWVLLEFWGYW